MVFEFKKKEPKPQVQKVEELDSNSNNQPKHFEVSKLG